MTLHNAATGSATGSDENRSVDAEAGAGGAVGANGVEGRKRYGTRSTTASRRALTDVSNRAPAPLQSRGITKPNVAIVPPSGKRRAPLAVEDPIARRTRAMRRRATDEEKSVGAKVAKAEPAVVEVAVPANDDIKAAEICGDDLPSPRHVVFVDTTAKVYVASLRIPAGVKDIDQADADADVHLAEPSLAMAIMRTYQAREAATMASASYMRDMQPDLSARMRQILVDWLVDVHLTFRLCAESLYLAVNIVDRFLTLNACSRSKLQLVGVAALWIASKYEEVYPPVLDDFVAITDWTYSRERVLKMEALIANRLGFRLTVVTPLPFVRRTLKALQSTLPAADARIAHLAHYILELSLCSYDMLAHRPSLLAASAVALAAHALGSCRMAWDGTMRYHSGGYQVADLERCALQLWTLVQSSGANSKATAVRRKYSGEKYSAIALLADGLEFNVDGERDKC